MIETLILLFLLGTAFGQELQWPDDESAHGFIVHYDTIEAEEECLPQEVYRHQINVGKTNILDIGADDQFLVNKRYRFQVSSYAVYDGATYQSGLSEAPVCLDKRLNLEKVEDLEVTSSSDTKKKKEENKQPSKGDGKDEKQQQKSVTSISGFVRVDSSPESRGANPASLAGRNKNSVGSVEARSPAQRVQALLPPVFNSNGPRVSAGYNRAPEPPSVGNRNDEDLLQAPSRGRDSVQSERELLHDDVSISDGRDHSSGVRSVAASLREINAAPEPASERNYNSVIIALLGVLALAGLYLGLRKKA